MNREIKFRCFDGKQMIYPSIVGVNPLENFAWKHRRNYLHNCQDWSNEEGFILSPKLMQFTGRKDAEINGKEVWEGDIIENCDTKLLQVVYWHEDKSAWYCQYVNDEKRVVSLWESLGNLNKVIGNIYENTSLIGDIEK